MSRVKIKTLTPIHVGSGEFLQKNTDFFDYKDGEESMLGVIDESKILEIIGEEHVQDWVLSIEKGESVEKLVSRFSPQSKPEDYIQRSILNYAPDVSELPTLKECLHNGLGIPYIPGSSIKGAIRTCIMSTLLNESEDQNQYLQLESLQTQTPKNRKEARAQKKANEEVSQRIENSLFGKDPYTSMFRFFHVGDAMFPKDCEQSVLLVNLNVRGSNDLWDKSKKQLVEVIEAEVESEINLKMDVKGNSLCNSQNGQIKKIPQSIDSLPKLFMLINQHTKKLLKEELEIWQDISSEKTGAYYYIDSIKQVLHEVNSCKEHECVLRLGHTSGWRFITGAWTERWDEFDNVIPNLARPGNVQRYKDYMFPKSRRLDADGYILGFIKMTMA